MRMARLVILRKLLIREIMLLTLVLNFEHVVMKVGNGWLCHITTLNRITGWLMNYFRL